MDRRRKTLLWLSLWQLHFFFQKIKCYININLVIIAILKKLYIKIFYKLQNNKFTMPIKNHLTIKLQSYSERNKLETFQANIWKELKMLQHMPNLLLFSLFLYFFREQTAVVRFACISFIVSARRSIIFLNRRIHEWSHGNILICLSCWVD